MVGSPEVTLNFLERERENLLCRSRWSLGVPPVLKLASSQVSGERNQASPWCRIHGKTEQTGILLGEESLGFFSLRIRYVSRFSERLWEEANSQQKICCSTRAGWDTQIHAPMSLTFRWKIPLGLVVCRNLDFFPPPFPLPTSGLPKNISKSSLA